MRIGMLTGGGDCPGLNAVLRAIVRAGEECHGDELVGFADGWRGVIEQDHVVLDRRALHGTLPRGGTILGSSRTNPLTTDGGIDQAKAAFSDVGLDALVAIGGEDTLGVAAALYDLGLPIVGVPKTIDNDLSGTELTFGFQTAVQTCTDAIDRLHTTAESHDRVIIVEVMGRHAGHIALWSGIAGGAAVVLVPEEPFDIDEVCEAIRRRHEGGQHLASIVVAAEGAIPREGTLSTTSHEVDSFGHARIGGVGALLAREIAERTRFDVRVTVLGYIQRGGTPTAFDRVLATRFGVAAVEAVHDGDFGTMMALRSGRIERIPLVEGVGSLKLVSPELLEIAHLFSR